MSRLARAVRTNRNLNPALQPVDLLTGQVKNFMDGNSFTLNPLDTFKLVSASSIFGEPSYYRGSKLSRRPVATEPSQTRVQPVVPTHTTTEDVFLRSLNRSLDHDYNATLEFLTKLREDYFMRLNPSVALVTAAIHPQRTAFNRDNPMKFREIGKSIIKRPDDIRAQFDYWMYLKGSKNGLPNVLKKVWADRLVEFDQYQIAKYQSSGIRDMVRISNIKHSSEVINTLMNTQGSVPMPDTTSTWERLKSQGKNWVEIFNSIRIPHMALLRNLRGMSQDLAMSEVVMEKVLENLVSGVPYGKQFPYRYYSARKAIEEIPANIYTDDIKDTLEKCMDVALANFPKLKGKTACLSDNSGSAHGAFTSEFGRVSISDIGNLSSVMTAFNSDEGEIIPFGDRIKRIPSAGQGSILKAHELVNELGKKVGGATENGIWMFFDEAIKDKMHYDNIFIYSDQQAGHGGLYGIDSNKYKDYIFGGGDPYSRAYIDVMKMIQVYRQNVNPKVNIFSVQTAGYDNSVVPENIYRGAILSGWTGKEVLFAKTIIDLWDHSEMEQTVAI